jgi:hypothetical protein
MAIVFRRHQKAFLARLDLAALETAIREAERATTGRNPRRGPAARPGRAREGGRARGRAPRDDADEGAQRRPDPRRPGAPDVPRLGRHGDPRDASGEDFWKEVAAAIEERFRAGDFTGGLVHGIETAGRELAAHFPAGPGGHANQLPDRVET